MSSQAIIRPMRSTDLDAIMQVEYSAYAFPWSKGIFSDCLRADYGCWVIELNQEIIGHGIITSAAQEAHLLNICIKSDKQQQGFGRLLVQHLINEAHNSQAESLLLEVRPSNNDALRLYQSLGFTQIGRRKQYYPAATGREDALILALDLSKFSRTNPSSDTSRAIL